MCCSSLNGFAHCARRNDFAHSKTLTVRLIRNTKPLSSKKIEHSREGANPNLHDTFAIARNHAIAFACPVTTRGLLLRGLLLSVCTGAQMRGCSLVRVVKHNFSCCMPSFKIIICFDHIDKRKRLIDDGSNDAFCNKVKHKLQAVSRGFHCNPVILWRRLWT